MKASGELIDKIAGAVSALEGLGLESSVADGVRWPGRSTAIELGTGIVEIRVVATALPLKTLLGRLAEAVEPLLADTPWAGATIRMVVTRLAASAFETD
ncbi:hypothetical protein OHB26_25395 [Nocardia sp. NBC_01503]|uniref:hypothetical protein n=1 Tax=Nocardia sp. NBC_01503 TaxID=2975997 RepID=UPI002E7C0187|nr:hypothetical protein [Nocardia sp. NBC_01503]WTL30265.1 hypothetical protein OHB26_25395 [Nocardia sp. NBC_01503]